MFYILQFINFKDVFIIFPEHYKINPYIEARELKNVLNFNHLFKNLKEQSCVIINNTHSSRKVNLLKKSRRLQKQASPSGHHTVFEKMLSILIEN